MNTHSIRSTLLSTLGVALALASGSALAISFRLTELTLPGGSFSRGSDLNESGQVTGGANTADGAFHAFLWDGTRMRDLGALGGTSSSGLAINTSGQVTGSADTAEGNEHAFLWNGTTMLDLGTLGGRRSEGRAINDAGQVTGGATRPECCFCCIHAFLWDGTTMQDLGTVGGADSVGNAINVSGQVTGFAKDGSDTDHAFLWDGTALQDLNALIDLADPLQQFVTLEFGVDINDLGQILAHGVDGRTGEGHAYLLSPIPDGVPEPGTLALLGVGLAGLGLTRRRATGPTQAH